MPQLRVKVILAGGTYKVDLPNYVMVPGSWLPVVAGVTSRDGVLAGVRPDNPALRGLTCLVNIPDDDCDPESGQVSMLRLAGRYAGQPKWGDVDYVPDITPG